MPPDVSRPPPLLEAAHAPPNLERNLPMIPKEDTERPSLSPPVLNQPGEPSAPQDEAHQPQLSPPVLNQPGEPMMPMEGANQPSMSPPKLNQPSQMEASPSADASMPEMESAHEAPTISEPPVNESAMMGLPAEPLAGPPTIDEGPDLADEPRAMDGPPAFGESQGFSAMESEPPALEAPPIMDGLPPMEASKVPTLMEEPSVDLPPMGAFSAPEINEPQQQMEEMQSAERMRELESAPGGVVESPPVMRDTLPKVVDGPPDMDEPLSMPEHQGGMESGPPVQMLENNVSEAELEALPGSIEPVIGAKPMEPEPLVPELDSAQDALGQDKAENPDVTEQAENGSD